jgi:hypothetical protein
MDSIMSWKKTSIKSYQLIADIGEGLEPVDKGIWTLCALTGKPYEYYETISIKELEKLLEKTVYLQTEPEGIAQRPIRIGWYWYSFTADKGELLAHQFVAIQKLWESGYVANLHTMLAYLTIKRNIFGFRVKIKNPVKEFENRSELFRNKLSVHHALSHLLFFWTYYLRSLKTTLQYLEGQVKARAKAGAGG